MVDPGRIHREGTMKRLVDCHKFLFGAFLYGRSDWSLRSSKVNGDGDFD